jgi:drug/metabolite transporter (DMT)-like permease
VPVLAAGAAVVLLDEPASARLVLSGTAILLGIALATFRPVTRTVTSTRRASAR